MQPIDKNQPERLNQEGVRIEYEIKIRKPAADLYRFWRKLENLPKFMTHLKRVEEKGEDLSLWTAEGPAGDVSWTARIVEDRPEQLISWETLEADVPHAGSISFTPTADLSGTAVKVTLRYDPPAGMAGVIAAKILGKEPKQQIAEDLKRFKEVMEIGTGAGQKAA